MFEGETTARLLGGAHLGRVGETLLVPKEERREVTVRHDTERLVEIVGELELMAPSMAR